MRKTNFGRVIGEADARFKLLVVRIVQRAAVAVLARQEYFAGESVDIRLAIGNFVQRLDEFPTHAEVDRQIARQFVIVLNKDSVAPMPLAPFPDYRAAALGGKQIHQEVAVCEAGTHGAVEGERTERAVVPGVVAVLTEADKLCPHLYKMLAFLPCQIVGILQLIIDCAAD